MESTKPTADTLLNLLKEATATPVDDLCSDEQRYDLLAALRNLTLRLQPAGELIWNLLLQPHQNAMIGLAAEFDLFNMIDDDGQGKTAVELAEATGAEASLIVRIMRVLTAIGIFSEIDEQKYGATPISQAWRNPAVKGATKHLFDESAYSLAALPEFLKATNYRNPQDNAHNPFQFANKTQDGMWDFISQRPERFNAFNTAMQGQRAQKLKWFESFPIAESLFAGLKGDPHAVALVDVGGGRGHDLEAFKQAFPDRKGRLILQDQADVIDDIKHLPVGIESMPYDFFTPQPVQGARAYYFRRIMHDWPDDKCQVILRHTAAAMEKGYSKALFNDWVIQDKDCPLLAATMDINMMVLFSGMERSTRQWTDLLSSVGLKIVKIHSVGPDSEGLVEAGLA